jgi:cyclophilin family peptidyl-prolyl cis-trans isomerase/HEAT repeat protein
MSKIRSTLSLWTLSILAGCAVPVRTTISPDALLAGVKQAELQRDAYSPAVAHALVAQQRELRIAALKTLARTADVGTASIAMPLLGDRDEEVATWAAFALGEIGAPEGEAALLSALRNVSPVPERVLAALGRSGTATAARQLVVYLDDSRPSVRANAARAIGLIAKRSGTELAKAKLSAKLAPLVKDADREVRFGAVYGLMRAQGAGASVALIPALGDKDAEIRATATRGLGLANAAPQVFDVVIRDPDWRVRVEVVRALGALAKASKDDAPAAATRLASIAERELAAMKAGGVLGSGVATHVLLAIAETATALGDEGQRVITLLEKAPWEPNAGFGPETAPDLARVSCAISFARDRAENTVRRVKSCGDATMPAWRREQLAARLYAEEGGARSVAALIQMTGHADPRVRTAAVEGLAGLAPEAQGLVASIGALVRLLESNDPYLAAAAADALSRKELASLRPPDLVARFGKLLDSAAEKMDASYAIGVLDAIGALGESARSLLPKLEELSRDPRAAIRRRAAAARTAITGQAVSFGAGTEELAEPKPLPIPNTMILSFRTVRGTFEMELDGALAPETTGVLSHLTAVGFYKDRVFHRVVSDFVAQGGCPRGDGWGGPGYTIADEVSPSLFVRGAVGIATSGRDTGGSQFFVMHAYHPHLDGAYAAVGRVVLGMEVVDALQPDDRIIEAKVIRR